MIESLQIVSFEIGASCNLSAAHPWCPSNDPSRYADSTTPPATDADFLGFLDSLIADGFKGFVAMHYYNEPTLDQERCQALAQGVRARGLKTLCWTNGTHPVPEGAFDAVLRTPYPSPHPSPARGEGEANPEPRAVALRPDNRLDIYITPAVGSGPCWRPSRLELVVNFYGDLRMCCGDWRGAVRIGNVKRDPHNEILWAWRGAARAAENGEHEVCKRCHALACSPALINPDYKLET